MMETSKQRAEAHLDLLVASARDQEVSDRSAAACVAGVQQWRVQALADKASLRTTRWTWALGGGLAVAALMLLVLPLRSQSVAPLAGQQPEAAAPIVALAPIQVGERVALSASEDSAYVVTAVSAERTEIAVQRGAVTARLYPNAQRDHELVLVAGDLEVRATGTIFTVGLDAAGTPYSLVHEGSVAVRRGEQSMAINAGQAFPSDATRDASVGDAAQTLIKHDLLVYKARVVALPPALPDEIPDLSDASPVKTSAPKDTAATEPVQLWREARALRSTGQSESAIVTLSQLVASNDATWSPLAQLELARLYDSDLSQPDKTLTHAKAFLKRYEKHELAQEARKLACQALGQLGRTDASMCP